MEASHQKQVILITGSSTGFGKLTAETLARRGHCVYASMREPEGRNAEAAGAFASLAKREGLDLHVLALDVTDAESVTGAVDRLIEAQGRVDVLVNNAGIMNVGITEAYTLDQVERQMDVNFLGAVRCDRAVLPHKRRQGAGLMIHVTSLAGRLVFPFFGVYCASKFAVEALAESYRYELSGQGIDSVIVEPGPFATALIGNSPKPEDEARLSAYCEVAAIPETLLRSFDEFLHGPDAPDPQEVADDIARLINMPAGERPMRTVSGLDYGTRTLNEAAAPVQRAMLEALGLSQLDPLAQAPQASVKTA